MSNPAEPKKSPAIFMPICSRPPYRLQTISAGSVLFAGGQISYLAPKGGHEAKMSNVPIQDDVPETFDRRTCLSILRPHLAPDDFCHIPTFFHLLNEGFIAHTRTERAYLDATHTHHATPYRLSEVNPGHNCPSKPPFRSLNIPSGASTLPQPHSLFLPGSVTHTTKGTNPNEINRNRLQDDPLEGARWPVLASCGQFAGDSRSSSLRQEAIGLGFPHHALDAVDQHGAPHAMGMGGGETGARPESSRQVPPRVVFLPGPRPYAIKRMYWMENLVIEEEAQWEVAA